jgi:hypothetical protein
LVGVDLGGAICRRSDMDDRTERNLTAAGAEARSMVKALALFAAGVIILVLFGLVLFGG